MSDDSPLGGGPMEYAAAIQSANRARPGIEARAPAGINRDGPAQPLQDINGYQTANPGRLVNYKYSPPLEKTGVLNPDNSAGNPYPPYHDGVQQLLMIGQEQIGWTWTTPAGLGGGGAVTSDMPADSKTGKLLGGVSPTDPNVDPTIAFVAPLPAGYTG